MFGSIAYVHVQKDRRVGLSPHMEKCIFVGYPSQFKGWEFYNPSTRKFVLSDRADFDERTVGESQDGRGNLSLYFWGETTCPYIHGWLF